MNKTRRRFLQWTVAGAASARFSMASAEPRSPMDSYWPEPRSTFEQRRQSYLDYCCANARPGRNGIFSQLARLELAKQPLDETIVREAIAFVHANQGCNDFAIGGLLRILHKYRRSPLLSESMVRDIEQCVLSFRYWWDEPNQDKRCYHTENHQIIFHSDELLAGQLFPDRVFNNSGKTGRYHIQHALHLLRRWIHFRVAFGFSEWLSNGYFDHDLMALANLRDFAEAPDVRDRAEMLIDLLLFEIALHSYRGIFGSTHGRTYAHMIKGGRDEHTASIAKLMFGMGSSTNPTVPGRLLWPPAAIAVQPSLKESPPTSVRPDYTRSVTASTSPTPRSTDCHLMILKMA